MLTFVIRRMIATVFVVFTITVLVFLIFFHTPGVDPARKLAGRNPSPETIKAIKHQYGLDRPLPVQYVILMKKLFISRDLDLVHATRARRWCPRSWPPRR